MSSFQKIIKYLAIAFAVFLIFSVISAICLGISTFTNLLDYKNDTYISDSLEAITIKNNDIDILEIDIKTARLVLQTGDSLKVETNNENIKCRETKNQLHIEEKSHNILGMNHTSELMITIPANVTFDRVSIESGAGTVKIEELITNDLFLDLGAGKVIIDKLTVTREAEIEGGAGEFSILSGNIHNLDLDMGVGKLSLSTTLTGNNKIDAGIGEVEIVLFGSKEDYRIHAQKGIGALQIDGENISENVTTGNGMNQLELDGGVGKIAIDFKKKTSIFPTN